MMNRNRSNFGNERRTRATRPWLLAAALAFVIPACAPDTDETAEGDFDAGDPMAETERELDRETYGEPLPGEVEGEASVQLTVQQSDTHGEYIASAEGRPLYVFTADQQGEASACYDECVEAWPPVSGSAMAGTGLDTSLLGTITREDGSLQATYNGWPLYEFARDSGDQPSGHNIESFGGEWYLISPDGEEVHAE
jgi:predicted lipoprotein with Yx(FWY)xxD motif